MINRLTDDLFLMFDLRCSSSKSFRLSIDASFMLCLSMKSFTFNLNSLESESNHHTQC
jgi:hypothetical protein